MEDSFSCTCISLTLSVANGAGVPFIRVMLARNLVDDHTACYTGPSINPCLTDGRCNAAVNVE